MHGQRTAMILAAGLGTRLKPLTDSMPKALVPYRGKPMLEHLILKLKDAGFGRIVINVHHFASMIEDFVSSNSYFGLDIVFSDETDLLRDTGGGIRHAAPLLLYGHSDAPVLVHNVDIVSDIDLAAAYSESEAEMMASPETIACLAVTARESRRYLLFDRDSCLRGWLDTSDGRTKGICSPGFDRRAFSGIHFISPRMIGLMQEWPERFSVIDFYLEQSSRYRIKGLQSAKGISVTDIGKIRTLSEVG